MSCVSGSVAGTPATEVAPAYTGLTAPFEPPVLRSNMFATIARTMTTRMGKNALRMNLLTSSLSTRGPACRVGRPPDISD